MVAELIDDSITRNSILYPNNKLWICLTAKCQIALTSFTHRTLLYALLTFILTIYLHASYI